MADQNDKVLTEYFTGVLQMKINMRKRELQINSEVDENVGGGRAQNKQARPLDNMLIRFERDPLLVKWENQQRNIREWLKTCTEAQKQVLVFFYAELSKEVHQSNKTAVIELYAQQHNVQVKWLYKERNRFKKMVGIWLR